MLILYLFHHEVYLKIKKSGQAKRHILHYLKFKIAFYTLICNFLLLLQSLKIQSTVVCESNVYSVKLMSRLNKVSTFSHNVPIWNHFHLNNVRFHEKYENFRKTHGNLKLVLEKKLCSLSTERVPKQQNILELM